MRRKDGLRRGRSSAQDKPSLWRVQLDSMPGGGHFGFAVSDAAPFEFDVMGGEVPCLNDAERERGQSRHGPWHCCKDAASGFFMRVEVI